MLTILQTLNNGWIVRDSAYRGESYEDHEETVPMDFPGMRIPEVSPVELWEGYKSLDQDGIKGRIKNWTSIGPVLSSMDIRLTSTFVRERRADAVSVGRFSVAHADKVESQLQHFALCLLTGRIGMEENKKEDKTKSLTYFLLDEQRCTGREPYNIEEQYRANIPRDKFDGIALALREMGRVRCFDPTLIKITHTDGNVSWGRIDKGLMVPVDEPDEMIIPGTELVAPKDAQDRIEALQKYWVGVGDDKTLAFKARAAMAWAISTLPPSGKVFTWFDQGGTGKTSFMNGFDACFPSKSVSVNWDNINRGDFALGAEFSRMIGKTVSFSDETPQLARMNGALNTLKLLSTGATVTARHGNGKFSDVYLNPWQVLFSNTGSVFPRGYAFERRLVQMPEVPEVAARRFQEEMHGNEKMGRWLFSDEEVGKTFMSLAICGKHIWEEEFQCEWPEELAKWDGEEDDTSDDQFCLPPKDSDIYGECKAVADTLKGKSKLFVEGVRKLARVWNAADEWFYGDHAADSSVTGRIPRSMMLLDEKVEGFNASHTACHDPSTVSGFIPNDDRTVDNFSKMLLELGVKCESIKHRGGFYPGSPTSLRAPHAEESDRWKAVRIVLGVQAYGPAVYEAPEVEVPVKNEEDVTPITPGTETQMVTIPPVDATPIPPVPSPIKMGSRAAQRAIHATYHVEGDLIPVTPDKDKHPKGKWKNENRANGTATKLTKTWPGDEKACAFIPTGHTVILDLDCHNNGKSGWEVLNEEVGIYGTDAFPETLGELTPSGGIHLLYHVDDLKFVERLKNMSHPKGIEVDVKCDGRGMATCAGSVIPEKGTYKVCSLPKGNRLAEMSENLKSWLAHHDYLKPDPAETERKRKEEEARRARRRAERDARRALGEDYSKPDWMNDVESEFDKAIDSIATAPSGGRNNLLNTTAFYLFKKSIRLNEQYPEDWLDWLDDEELKSRLVDAGIESGLERSEVIATVQSAWSKAFGGTTTVVAPAGTTTVIEPVITPEEDTEVQHVVNEDLTKASIKGASLFQATGYSVDWRGNFHKTSQEELETIHEDDANDGWGEPVNSIETKASQEELETIHENNEWGNGLFGPDEYDGWCKLVDKLNTSQEELNDLHEDDNPYTNGSLFGDDGIDGWGNPDYETNYEIIPLDEETNTNQALDDPHTNGSRFEDLFDEDESTGWFNPEYDVYEVNYPIIPLDEEIGIDDLGF